MDKKDDVLAYIRMKGPSLPNEVAKHIGGDTFLAAAYLSELKEMQKLKISNLKVGGGSPLYYIPGQEQNLQNFSDNLNEKNKKAYEILKSRKVVRDISLVPVFRAAMRSIKDFAVPLTATIEGKKELFWRWYLLPNHEAETVVKKMFSKPKLMPKKPVVKTTQEKLAQEEKPIVKKEIEHNFYDEVLSYFKKNKIKVLEEKIIRKSSELDFIVDIPSSLGELRYYVKAKSKKKVNDGDLSSVFIQGQTKRLPVLFLGKGDLSKKAQAMLEEEFKGMRFNKIGS